MNSLLEIQASLIASEAAEGTYEIIKWTAGAGLTEMGAIRTVRFRHGSIDLDGWNSEAKVWVLIGPMEQRNPGSLLTYDTSGGFRESTAVTRPDWTVELPNRAVYVSTPVNTAGSSTPVNALPVGFGLAVQGEHSSAAQYLIDTGAMVQEAQRLMEEIAAEYGEDFFRETRNGPGRG